MDEVGLGKRLQEARQKAGLTQQELCQRADISYSTLAKIERGAIKAPSIFTIERIASVLGVTLDDLLGRTQAPTLPPIVPKKVSKSGIRFVYFDVNGCLVRFFHHALTRMSEDFNVPADTVEAVFWHNNDAVCKGEITLDEFNDRLAKALDAEEVDWMKYYIEEVDPIPEMHQLVTWVSEHYHVGLMTNIMPGLINEMLQHKLIPDIPYDTIVDSSQVGAIKPEEAIYEEAEERAACQPDEILLVDDSRSNVMAAQKRGWRVLWFDDYRPGESAERIKSSLEFEES